jgi:cell division transport system ATP-binding protein
MIELFHIWKQYQKPHWALSDVSLQIRVGDFYFVTGPSGSGKTTLLKIIFRELLPTEGQILIDGVNALKIPDSKIWKLRRQMGIVFQDFRLMFHRSVFENVSVPLQVIGLPRKEIRRRVFATLQSVNLHQKMWELPSRLSYGEQQRVAIARAIINNPEIILADEPTGNLDPELAFEIVSLFKEINRQGTTVLIGSHDRELIRHFGQNIIFLQKGRIVGKEGR